MYQIKTGSLTIFAKGKPIHLIGWLRRPMIWALQSDGVAIGLSVLQKLSKSQIKILAKIV